MKVLHVVPSLDGSGIAKILHDYLSEMPDGVIFDFVVCNNQKGIFEDSLLRMGCQIYHLPKIRQGLFRYIKLLSRIVKNGNYDIIHDHNDYHSYFDLMIAKKHRIKVRIAHSHRANQPLSIFSRIVKAIFTPLTKKVSTDLFACGKNASNWAWGNNCKKVFIMKNAIYTNRFAFSAYNRESIRNEFGLNNKFVVGNVARFSIQKNHQFLLNVFSLLVKEKSDAVLLLIGGGELYDQIVKLSKDLGISENVVFVGTRNDVEAILSAMDLFLLPSIFEGLPVSLLEVQANGLPSFVSNTVTSEMKILDCMTFLPIDDPREWVKAIMDSENRRVNADLSNSEYDISCASRELYNYYNYLISHHE